MNKHLDTPRNEGSRIDYRYTDAPYVDEKDYRLLLNTTEMYNYYMLRVNANVVALLADMENRPDFYANSNNIPERLRDFISDTHITVNEGRHVIELKEVLVYGEVNNTAKRFDNTIARYFKSVHKDGWYWNYARKHYHNYGVGFKEGLPMFNSALRVLKDPEHILIYRIPCER